MTREEEKRLYVQLLVALNEISQRLYCLARTVSSLPRHQRTLLGGTLITSTDAKEAISNACFSCDIACKYLDFLQPQGEA